MSAISLRAPIFALVWWLLVEGGVDSWGIGLILVVLAVAAGLRLWPSWPYRLSPAGLLGYAGFFLVQPVRGVQFAAMALRPCSPCFLSLSEPPGRDRIGLGP